MIETHKHSEAAKIFMQIRLSSLENLLAQHLCRKTMFKDGFAFSLLPDRLTDLPVECFEADTLQLTSAEAEEIRKLEAAFIYQLLGGDRDAVLITTGPQQQNLPNPRGLKITHLGSTRPEDGETTHCVISPDGGGLDAVNAFWEYLAEGFPLACGLAYLPAGIGKASPSGDIYDHSSRMIAARCQHVILSAFTHYGKVFWTWASSQIDAPVPPSGDFDKQIAAPLVRIELERSTRHYFQQRLCDSVWRS